MTSGNFDGDTLKVFFNRIVNLEKEKRAEAANFQADIKQVYAEAKDFGFTPKIIRGLVAEHLAPQKDQEDLDLEAIYRDALGLGGSPLDQAAKDREAKDRKPKQKGTKKAGKENVAPAAGEKQKAGKVAAADLPEDPLEAAKVIALQASFGKIETGYASEDGARFQAVRTKSAVGSVGEEMDDVHFALLEAGYHHVKGNTYAVPAAAQPAEETTP